MKITFITGNPKKAEELARMLDYSIYNLDLELPEIQSFDLRDIALYKAQVAWPQIKEGYVLVEDTGLRFHAFDKLPGPFIKWFYKKLHNEGLIKLLKGYRDKRASAEICYCLYDGTTPLFFEAFIGGEIARRPKGGQGFGWDAIFIPDGYKKTWGQMTAIEKDETSMRNKALLELKNYLDKK